jgi:hypothetical protein
MSSWAFEEGGSQTKNSGFKSLHLLSCIYDLFQKQKDVYVIL